MRAPDIAIFLAMSLFAVVPFVVGAITYVICRPVTRGTWIAWNITEAILIL